MKTHLIASWMLLPATFAWAATPTQPAPSPVLSLAPADALAIVYIEKPTDLLRHPLLATLQEGCNGEPVAVLKPLAEVFAGPTFLSVCGTPMNLAEFRVELASRPTLPEADFFKKLDEEVLPGIGKLAFVDPSGGVGTSGLLRTIRLPGPMPIVVFAAAKDGTIYGSSRRSDVEAWLQGEPLPPRFVDSDEYKRLYGGQATRPDALAYVNLRPLMPLALAEAERSGMGPLSKVLRLDGLEAAGLTVQWAVPPAAARLTVATANTEGGLTELLGPRNAALEIPSLVPSDYTFVVRGAVDNGAAMWDRLASLLDSIDPDIAGEFRQECLEFRDEIGFDPYADFLGNIVDEGMVAVRVISPERIQWLAAARLADPVAFQSQVAAMASAFDLPFSAWIYRDVVIQSTPPDSRVRLALACVDDFVVVAEDAENIREAVDARRDGAAIAQSSGFLAVRKHLPAEMARFAFADVSRLLRVFAEEIEKDTESAGILEMVRRIAGGEVGVGLAVSGSPGLLAADVVLNEGGDAAGVRSAMWSTVSTGITQARQAAVQALSASNMRFILMGCQMFANDHKNVWPAALSDLVRNGSFTLRMFDSPRRDSGVVLTVDNVDRESCYLYRPGTGLAPTEVVVCERELQNGSANFGFVDGHVERITGDRAAELLAMMKSFGR